MSNNPLLLALAERVEGASGPDRELACTIAKAIGWVPEEGEPGGTTSSPWAWCPDFTASLDAAMTLVPEGSHIGLGADAIGPLKGWAWVRTNIGGTWEEFHSPAREGLRYLAPYPQSIALALCAAAIRVLATSEPE